MALELQIGERTANIEKISENNSRMLITIDGVEYDVDVLMVEEGVYSIIYKGKSFNVELVTNDDPKSYTVKTLYNNYSIEIIDAERKYLMSRRGGELDDENHIASPMPGKVVRIPVNVGDEVKAGEPVVIVSAMKMESEYKVKKDRVVKDILVKEGDVIEGNQTLVIVE